MNAAIAGEIARRSDRALGHQGLAARLGASTPEGAIQSLTGVTLADAKALTVVGAALGAALGGALSGTGVGAAADVGSPWLAPVTNAVADGSLSVASAAAITRGLGVPTDTVAADDLLDAATELVDLARESTPESAARSARIMRERLDVASIADLEAHRRSRRSLKWFEQPDGMTRMVALLDPESAAIITGAIDTVMSPRRGGPRFVDTEQASKAADMVDDPRTNDQFAVDTLVEIVNLATRAANCTIDQVKLFGDRSPAVRVHIQADTLRSTSGPGTAAGRRWWHPRPHSHSQPHRCRLHRGSDRIRQHRDRRTVHLHLGNPADHLLRHHRHRRRQHPPAPQPTTTDRDRRPMERMRLARLPPPALMTEVHHIDAFDGTNTTLSNAIPLCRFHHMELHANHWTITRNKDDSTYWLHPPPAIPAHATFSPPLGASRPNTSGPYRPATTPRQLRSKNPLILQRAGRT